MCSKEPVTVILEYLRSPVMINAAREVQQFFPYCIAWDDWDLFCVLSLLKYRFLLQTVEDSDAFLCNDSDLSPLFRVEPAYFDVGREPVFVLTANEGNLLVVSGPISFCATRYLRWPLAGQVIAYVERVWSEVGDDFSLSLGRQEAGPF